MAVLWNSAGGALIIVISLFFSIVLARLLEPSDFGTMAIIMVLYILSQVIVRFGLETAIIQKTEVSDEEYSMAFFIMFFFSTLFALLLFFSAGWLGRYYENTDLDYLCKIFSSLYFIDAIMHIQRIKLKKQLDFKRINIIEVSAKIIGGTLAVIMALQGMGIMSLVVQNLSIAAIQTILICYHVKWWPSIHFKLSSISKLFHYGKYILVSDFVYEISQRFDSLIIGKYFNLGLLGLYDKGKSLSEMGQRLPANLMMKPLFTSMSERQDDKPGLERMMNKIYISLSFIFIPLLLFLVFNATQLIRFVYGEKWIGAAPYFSLFCIMGVFYLIRIPTNYLLLAMGKVKITFRIEMFVNILKITSIILLASVNIIWMIYFLIAIRILEGVIYFYYIDKHLSFDVKSYLQIISLHLVMSLVLLIGIYYTMKNIGILSDLIHIFLSATIFAAIYLFIHYLIKSDGYTFHWDLVKQYIFKKNLNA